MVVLAAVCALLDLPGARGTAFGQRVAERIAGASMDSARQITGRLLPVADEGERRPPRAARSSGGIAGGEPGEDRYISFPSIARAEAKRAGIRRPGLFVRQIAAESAYNPCVRSPAGALGIAQIMPGTAAEWKVDPFEPAQALRTAAERMAGYERTYGSYRVALAAYNAGPGAVRRYGGVPPYAETRHYVRVIMDRRYELNGLDSTWKIAGGVDPQFERRLEALRADVLARGGGLRVNESWRSYDEQLRLWRRAKKTYGGFEGARMWVAPPGCSNHNRGIAADVEGSLKMAHRLAPRHGLVFPMQHEPWHVELAGIDTQSG